MERTGYPSPRRPIQHLVPHRLRDVPLPNAHGSVEVRDRPRHTQDPVVRATGSGAARGGAVAGLSVVPNVAARASLRSGTPRGHPVPRIHPTETARRDRLDERGIPPIWIQLREVHT